MSSTTAPRWVFAARCFPALATMTSSSICSSTMPANVALYPKFQAYFAERKPPLLAVWGKNDPFFLPPGAEAFRRDNPNAEVHFLDRSFCTRDPRRRYRERDPGVPRTHRGRQAARRIGRHIGLISLPGAGIVHELCPAGSEVRWLILFPEMRRSASQAARPR